jgi:lipoprotein-anchoring transpeptidase ErfK/SrfK
LPSAADGSAGPGAGATIAPVAASGGSAGDSGPATRPTPAGGVPASPDATEAAGVARRVALPADSGTGRRVVYSESRQRVWLVAGGEVRRTYPVSGSIYDNLDPGTYSVFSRSEQAWGIDDSGTMRYFVRFAHGDNAAIGFHDIPVDDGTPVQTVDQLGTPLSHGCIRQRRADAKALWAFAPVGTKVVVTA